MKTEDLRMYFMDIVTMGGDVMTRELPKRKNIRLQGYDYSSEGYYFITICVKDGHHLFGRVVRVECRPHGRQTPTELAI